MTAPGFMRKWILSSCPAGRWSWGRAGVPVAETDAQGRLVELAARGKPSIKMSKNRGQLAADPGDQGQGPLKIGAN
jgi:hypothetical protein